MLAVGGGWLLSRTTNALAPSVGVPAASAPGALEPSRTEVTAEAAAAPLPAASTVPTPIPHPHGATPTSSFAEALRKVQLTLQGHGTPKEMLEAATMLSACEGMDAAMEGTYRARDQNDPTFRRANSSAGVSSEQAIKHMEDVRRRCQVFDAAALARRGELLKGAYEGDAEGSALPYLVWINASQQAINPELRGKLQRDARQTAEDGDRIALAQFSLPFSTAALGITEVQRQAYREAGLRITGEASGAEEEKSSRASSDDTEKMMAKWGRMPPPLTPEQQREAGALAAKVVDAWRKRQAKGG
ncbi:hypothetical protein [Roseateles sp. P5_D6]